MVAVSLSIKGSLFHSLSLSGPPPLQTLRGGMHGDRVEINTWLSLEEITG